jgi:hypothetical protein
MLVTSRLLLERIFRERLRECDQERIIRKLHGVQVG